jgi:23S rRNA (adenine2503-C2)-methyltransferase
VPLARDPRPGVAGLAEEEVATLIGELGEPAFRSRQVSDAVWRAPAADWDEITTLARPLRAALAARLRFDTVAATTVRVTDGGATEKALHGLSDGRLVESVLMHYPGGADRRERNTLCISSQAGCAVGCPFCATGELGFDRDLEVAEIVDQARHARRRLDAAGRHLTNVVFMGMGEPLLNVPNVTVALDLLAREVSPKRTTLSTAGIVPGIEALALRPLRPNLAVSLSAADDETRNRLMPVNRTWPLAALFAALKKWPLERGRRITIEWVLIDGVNDDAVTARRLVALAKQLPSKVNLIPLNESAKWLPGLARPSAARIDAFARVLAEAGVDVTVRWSKGLQADAACGQLRGREEPRSRRSTP